MEAKLDQNRDKGDRNGWKQERVSWLLNRLLSEVGELVEVIGKKGVPGFGKEPRQARIRSECADVANFAMMIADVAGGLRPRAARTREGTE